jgi:lambda repressor-like predicted transcriptional regulator
LRLVAILLRRTTMMITNITESTPAQIRTIVAESIEVSPLLVWEQRFLKTLLQKFCSR